MNGTDSIRQNDITNRSEYSFQESNGKIEDVNSGAEEYKSETNVRRLSSANFENKTKQNTDTANKKKLI